MPHTSAHHILPVTKTTMTTSTSTRSREGAFVLLDRPLTVQSTTVDAGDDAAGGVIGGPPGGSQAIRARPKVQRHAPDLLARHSPVVLAGAQPSFRPGASIRRA